MAGKGGLAEQVRVGLEGRSENTVMSVPQPTFPAKQDELSKLWFRKPIRQHLKEFACVLAIIGLVITGTQVWHERFQYAALAGALSVVALCLGYFLPKALLPVWRLFMRVGEALGHVVTFVVLFVMWTLVLIPTSLGLRLFGKSLMTTKTDSAVSSYWESRDPAQDDFKLLEKQF